MFSKAWSKARAFLTEESQARLDSLVFFLATHESCLIALEELQSSHLLSPDGAHRLDKLFPAPAVPGIGAARDWPHQLASLTDIQTQLNYTKLFWIGLNKFNNNFRESNLPNSDDFNERTPLCLGFHSSLIHHLTTRFQIVSEISHPIFHNNFFDFVDLQTRLRDIQSDLVSTTRILEATRNSPQGDQGFRNLLPDSSRTLEVYTALFGAGNELEIAGINPPDP